MNFRRGFFALALLTIVAFPSFGQVSITTSPTTQTFDAIGNTATATLPTGFRADKNATTVRAVGTWAAAVSATEQRAAANMSTSAANGIYNYGAGATADGAAGTADRAIGFMSSSGGTRSGNVYAYLKNGSGGDFSGLTISYNVEKYRNGSNPAGYTIQLYYSLNGTTWTSAGSDFTTSFVADANNNGFATAPGVTSSVSNKPLTLSITAGTDFYLAWNYSVTTGTTTTNAQGLGVDNIVITGVPVAGGNSAPTITAPANPIATVTQDAAPFTVNLSGNDDGGIYNWTATAGTGVSNVVVSGASNTSNVTYQVTLQSGFNGTAQFTATLSDGVNSAVNQVVNIDVQPPVGVDNPPAITAPADPIKTVVHDAPPFTVNLTGSDDKSVYNWSATAGAGITSVTVSAGNGTPNVTYTVTLQPAFSGTATFTASLSDGVNPAVTQTVNITVVPPANHITISQVYGGGGNTYTNDYIELFNPTSVPVNVGGWSVQYASATGNFTQVQPIGGIIGPGEHFLIGLAFGGGTGTALPPANISGDINMSGTTGKVALVSNNDAVNGTSCVEFLADTDVVDFVGYGGSANCREGSANAPAPSTTTAIFRANNGDTDTNQNSADFSAAAPNPRRTAPIQEIGPFIFRVDPQNGSSTAPRDLSLVVTFTEAVNVDTGWFSISCETSGFHNNATEARAFDDELVVTPNVTFVPGELCTATIFKVFVHDQDLDDSIPGTDNPPSDYSWTFRIATGTEPPATQDVHLTMGNPSGATIDVNNSDNFLLEKPEMAISYNRSRGGANWVSWHLSDEWVGTLTRVDTFRPDPAIPPDWYRVLDSNYTGSGFDRGHMVPNADRDRETSIPINQATYLMTNILPQASDNNQGPWAAMENFLRTLLPANELYIVAGGAGTGGTGSTGFQTSIGNGNVTVPAQTWKVVMVLPKGDSDVSRVTAATRTIAVIMPNTQGIRNNDWMGYIVSVDAVEALTGYDFFSVVPDAIENAIEAGINGTNPPGATNSTSTLSEDGSTSITYHVANPTGAPLTYTIVTPPLFGSLSGADGAPTYTPQPNFNGVDSYTYKVNDGTADSNTAMVSITVREVNDAPIAVDDSTTAEQNKPHIFNAANLTANDSRGPSNEASQTLTVTSVAATGDTRGTVSLGGGQITYTPATGFSGSASFSYTVCDNGTTAGAPDSRCATGTVFVNISMQVPTHFGVQAPAAVSAGQPFSIIVTALDAVGNPVPGYIGTVHFTSTSGGSLPADYTFVASDRGTHTFNVTLTNAGLQTIVVADATIRGTAAIRVDGTTVLAPDPAIQVTDCTVAGGPCTLTASSVSGMSQTNWSYQWFVDGAPAGTTRVINPQLSAPGIYLVRLDVSLNGVVRSTTVTLTLAPPCAAGKLCMQNGRFEVSISARDQRTEMRADGVPTQQNGHFGFFSLPALTGNTKNPEVMVKVLDGRPINGNFWVFFSGLTDLEYTVTVLDKETGKVKTYLKPAGSSAGGFDTGSGVKPEACAGEVDGQLASAAPGSCTPGSNSLCLTSSRFRVELQARDQRTDRTATGVAIPHSDLFGYFSLPGLTNDATNPEVFVKVLDGRNVNGHFWVFFAGLTDLEYNVTVTDTVTGAVRTYSKAAGSACGGFDTNGF